MPRLSYEQETARQEKMKELERRLKGEGYRFIAGVDEAGRGPLAGPVYAAAVILPEDVRLDGINDSKKLSPKKREELFEEITEKAVAYAVFSADEKQIDEINILRATHMAMNGAGGAECALTGRRELSQSFGAVASASQLSGA